MDWQNDQEFLKDVLKRAKIELTKLKLERFLDEAFSDILSDFYSDKRKALSNLQKKLANLSHEKQREKLLAYFVKSVVNKAKNLARDEKKLTHPVLMENIIQTENQFADTVPEFKFLEDELKIEERHLMILLRCRYNQKQIADNLNISESTISRNVKGLKEKIENILNRKRNVIMKKQRYSDSKIYDFIDRKPDKKCLLGNDNLRRTIERMLKPLRESIPKILQGKTEPLIPEGLRKDIQEIIKQHKNPIKIHEVLAKMQKGSGNLRICLDLLEATRKLNQPYRWISPEDSTRVIEDIHHVSVASGWLMNAMAKAFQTYIIYDAKEKPQVTELVIIKLENIVERFKSNRGTGCVPFLTLQHHKTPLHKCAIEMNQEAETVFQTHFKKFKQACADMKKRKDTEVTIQDLQSMVDWQIYLLDWQIFSAPRYLAPAIMEEAIEVLEAQHGPANEKQNVLEELGDLLYMLLWMSNVLAIPNLGHELVNYA